MNELPTECVPCRGDLPPLTEGEAHELHAEHAPEWALDFPRLRRTYRLKDFRTALNWVLRVGELAEEQDHHPDIHLTSWNQVELVLWTHAIGGLHANDFVVANKLDELWDEAQR